MVKNPTIFEENFHLTVGQFDELYELIKEKLKPVRNTRPKDKIDGKQKLAAVLE